MQKRVSDPGGPQRVPLSGPIGRTGSGKVIGYLSLIAIKKAYSTELYFHSRTDFIWIAYRLNNYCIYSIDDVLSCTYYAPSIGGAQYEYDAELFKAKLNKIRDSH